MIDAATALDQLCVNTVRTLSIDAIQKANSGHPGAPLGLASLGCRLFTRHLRFDPTHPEWADRDRFVLSCGHASMLLYSLLHLSGYDVSIDDLRSFRQLGSRTAGHPERNHLPGVETTTGPLGQGLANAVGMAVAEQMLAASFNSDDLELVGHTTWVFASDGDLMEGVQAEAASLAGHLGLARLIVFYDDNRITIDGSTDITFSEDVAARYEAYGWQVLHLADPEDMQAIDEVIGEARSDPRPSLIVSRTHIGYGSPLQDTSKVHGSPLGADNVAATKEALGWPQVEAFHVPDEVREAFAQAAERGRAAHEEWQATFARVKREAPERAREFDRRQRGAPPVGWEAGLQSLDLSGIESIATRQASHMAINALAATTPELVGGSADLAESNLTDIEGGGSFSATSPAGRNIRFGIREHAMAAICSGIALHGGLRPFCGTFLVFSDYMRPSIRLAAMMGLPVIYVFTHDSVWLGEDGPTHQPIEHIASLRAIPNLLVLRPADANETRDAWEVAMRQTDRPVALLLTRQKLPVNRFGRDSDLQEPIVDRGGYVIRDCNGTPELILIATGSEVGECIEVARRLESDRIKTRVVSMPSVELFSEQSIDYRLTVLPSRVTTRLSVEAGVTQGWRQWVGEAGSCVGIERFGVSAPGDQAADHLGVCADAIYDTARRLVTRHREESEDQRG